MRNKCCYGDLAFEEDFVFALTAENRKIKFSKHERALLLEFTKNPNRLLSRERLLNAISAVGSDSIDRNIDYLISRLRSKLRDSAKTPRYIATQYGEGYLWIARAQQTLPIPIPSQSIYLSVGPVYGLAQAGEAASVSGSFVDKLVSELRNALGDQRQIELLPIESNTPPEEILRHRNASYALELSFLYLDNRLRCFLVALDRKTGQVFATIRHEISNAGESYDIDASTKKLAGEIRNSIWNAKIFRIGEQRSISDDPLLTGMYYATRLFEPQVDNTKEVEHTLREQLEKQPADHRSAILLATNIHSQLLSGNYENLQDREKEIEHLVLDHLPFVQNDALFLSAAAELLYESGHHQLGETLAERAIDIGPSLGACYMVLGRMKVMQGYIDEGLAYYERCEEMSEKDCSFYHLLQFKKCVAYKAKGDQRKVREVARWLVDNNRDPNPIVKVLLELCFLAGDDEAFSPAAAAAAAAVPKPYATYCLRVINYNSAQPFSNERHRVNLLKGAVDFFTKLHGEDVVPEEVRVCAPSLFPQ